jgi:hypothetical protein
MITAATRIEDLTLGITEEIHVRASLDATFAALLEQLGPYNGGPNSGRRPSSGRPCSRLPGRCSCPILPFQTYSTV